MECFDLAHQARYAKMLICGVEMILTLPFYSKVSLTMKTWYSRIGGNTHAGRKTKNRQSSRVPSREESLRQGPVSPMLRGLPSREDRGRGYGQAHKSTGVQGGAPQGAGRLLQGV